MHCAIDSNLLIYFLDSEHPLHTIVVDMFHAAEETELEISGSELLLGELLAYPVFDGQAAESVSDRLKLLPVRYHPVTLEVITKAAALCRKHPSLRLPDAIHIATAISAKANRFITNDKKLINRKKVDGLSIVALDA